MGHQKKNREKIFNFLESNGNQNTTYQNLWGTAKAVLRGKFITVSTFIKKSEKCQINNLMVQPLRKIRTSQTQKQ
jgi:hypothetical protein